MPPKTDPKQNGTIPEPTFALDLTAQEIKLIHFFCTEVPIGGALDKQIAAVVQVKIEQAVEAQVKLEQAVEAKQNGAPE